MAEHLSTDEFVRYVLGADHTLSPLDVGTDGHLSKWGLSFETSAWQIEDVGHLCSLTMHAPLGLMRMETVVIAPTQFDMPVANFDWVRAFGTETQIMEVYDTQLTPWPEECQEDLALISQRDADLANVRSEGAHWYDSILYPCSYHRKGKGVSERLECAVHDFIVTYLDQLAGAPACDIETKQQKVRGFAERLFAEGGPAVDMVVKLFGRDTARRLVVEHMYGVRGA